MNQDIIVYIIILAAVIYSIYAVIKSITGKKKSSCDGCSGCDIKNEITKNHHSTMKAKNNCNL
jgi:hypothetical protein